MTESLDEIYRKHGHVVLRRASQILGDDAEARDVLHDLFVELARDPAVVRGGIIAWLYARATFSCLDRLRRDRRRQQLWAQHTSADAAHAAGDDLVVLRQLFVRLPDDLAAIAVHHYLDGMTHAEIAELCGCSPRHVGNQLARIVAWAETAGRVA